MSKKIGVIGGGSWATAIAKMLSNNCDSVNWWMRDESQVQHFKEFNHNSKYLTAADFVSGVLEVSSDLGDVVKNSDILIVATPSAFIHTTFNGVDLSGKIIISAVKGIVPQTNEIPAEYFKNNFGVKLDRFGIICGPCHAEEVAMERLSYLTIASENKELATFISDQLSCRYIQCTVSTDVVGMEISAILKNVYALTSGVAHGLGYGDNFIAVLISNALQEIEAFTNATYPMERDVKLSAYLGDLLVTAYSPHSRNRRFGNMIGKGYSVKAIQQEMNMIAEGYYAAACIHKMNQTSKIDLPIAESIYDILYNNASPKLTIAQLSKKLA
jgi:glycerol-3-phosphate dehydrogenase (NAD(P)+)